MPDELVDPTPSPTTDPMGETDADVEAAETPSVTEAVQTTNPVGRTLKLVLTLQPREPTGYRVLVALGAAGCDPLLRCLEAEALPAILDAVPGLIAQAEAQWAVQPRYPSAAKSKAPTGKRETKRDPQLPQPDPGSATAAPTDTPPAADAPPPRSDRMPEPALTGQLSLLG